MRTIKLAEWCEKTGVKYLTAWRWFKGNKMPVHAYQTESGTILVEDDLDGDVNNGGVNMNNAMSLFLKKTVEFSKNNSSVEDFAAYIISNFQLRLPNAAPEGPKYSKKMPKPEEMQKHFQQFLPDKEEVERLKNVKTMITTGKDLSGNPVEEITFEEAQALLAPDEPMEVFLAATDTNTGGVVAQSVDFNTTPQQQINYTGSNYLASSVNCLASNTGLDAMYTSDSLIGNCAQPAVAATSLWDGQPLSTYFNAAAQATPFQPTQKELLSSAKVIETAETETLPRKRGRKPSIKRTQ